MELIGQCLRNRWIFSLFDDCHWQCPAAEDSFDAQWPPKKKGTKRVADVEEVDQFSSLESFGISR